MNEPFKHIAAALDRVESIAERVPDDVVQSSARAGQRTFAERGSVEPAVDRLQSSVSRLAKKDQPLPGQIVSQLDAVIAEQLLPELRRVGFEVLFRSLNSAPTLNVSDFFNSQGATSSSLWLVGRC